MQRPAFKLTYTGDLASIPKNMEESNDKQQTKVGGKEKYQKGGDGCEEEADYRASAEVDANCIRKAGREGCQTEAARIERLAESRLKPENRAEGAAEVVVGAAVLGSTQGYRCCYFGVLL
jgi:hypothetical protein